MEDKSLDETKKALDSVSKTFCLAKWFQTTVYLQNGYNHSCHHPSPHKIPLQEIQVNYKALHNTKYKKEQMQKMIDGIRPEECGYCWKVEDMENEHISDRFYKSSKSWALPRLEEAVNIGTNDHEPGYLEVSFSNVCNFKCVYCSPEISSMWYKEIAKFGPYPTSKMFNNFDYLRNTNRMPYDPNGENPYVDAFWKWWPELWPKLHTLRLTGGEPLLSRDAWKVLDFVIESDKPELTFGINTNLCVQDELIDKLIVKLNKIAAKVKEVQIFSSGEAMGAQGEYTRFGLDWEQWAKNMNKVAEQCPGVLLANMTTVNVLSLPTFTQFVEFLLDMREKYNVNSPFFQIQFMVNYLRFPSFLDVRLADDNTKATFTKQIQELVDKRGLNYPGKGRLLDTEIDQLLRLVDYMNGARPATFTTDRQDFAAFVDEADARRGTNFIETFPELKEFYDICQTS